MDRREEILNGYDQDLLGGAESIVTGVSLFSAKDAMDEYMKERCLELLTYVAKKVSNFWIDDNGEAKFRLSGDEELTKDQLFENFL